MCYLTFLKISASGMWVETPWGGLPASSTLDELHLSRIRADVRKLEKKYLEMELWLLSRG
ncbi:hypothetical protein N7471_005752 [Penicillium samsonianum]|uniref:uncharacterized protein n=1 Tax=Penicillium samsonianum TaxID=1882272 RepID=UPI002548EF22|nr:uncharacterized protein N7471_005752 [Penicillium samsonianum]KAJ6139266.1 hypothetical protein N7471_005752 [Penicillium samsonianum]